MFGQKCLHENIKIYIFIILLITKCNLSNNLYRFILKLNFTFLSFYINTFVRLYKCSEKLHIQLHSYIFFSSGTVKLFKKCLDHAIFYMLINKLRFFKESCKKIPNLISFRSQN